MNVSVTNVAELSPDSLHWGVLRLCRGAWHWKFDKNSTDL